MSSSDGDGEPQAKIPKKKATYEEFSELLAQPKEILLQIVNRLDPKSFVKLASCCKYLLNFCQNSKGIHVVFEVPNVAAMNGRNGSIGYVYWFPVLKDYEKGRKYMDQLRKWPFNICIDRVNFGNLNPNLTWYHVDEEIKAHFLTIGVRKIRKFSLYEPLVTVRDVEYLTKFVKTFSIEYADLGEMGGDRDVSLACLKLPVPKLSISRLDPYSNFDVDSVLQCSIPTLDYDVNLNLEQFGKILEMWKTRNGLKSWRFYYDSNSFNITSYFDDWEILRFTDACPIDSKRRLVFMDVIHGRYYEKKSFYLLRNDGKVLRVVFKPSHVEFDICPLNEAPPALRAL